MQFFGENWACVRGACEREISPTPAADGFPFHFSFPRHNRAEHALGAQPRVAVLLKRFSFAFFLYRSFARVSPVFAAALLAVLFSASLAASSTSNSNSHSNTSSADPAATVRRQSAS